MPIIQGKTFVVILLSIISLELDVRVRVLSNLIMYMYLIWSILHSRLHEDYLLRVSLFCSCI